ncbi:MAG: ATP-binding protein [Oscillospiraceae bacterium]
MIRRIIQIDEEKCTGCGLCANACHEGAIGMVSGKAKLLRDDYCDGLGDCLPSCPVNAISFVEREAADYDEAAVKKHLAEKNAHSCASSAPKFVCPGSLSKQLERIGGAETPTVSGELSQWPVQIKLVPVNAPFFANADILIAADCTAFAYGSFHRDFIKGRVTLIGCPKLDDTDYSLKLSQIFRANAVKSVTIARMEVPCCGGLENAVKRALAGLEIPTETVVISADGRIVNRY